MSDDVARHHKRHRRASRKPGDISGRAASQMVPALGCDDSLLNPGQKALALRLRQTQIRKVNKITGSPSHRRRMAGLPFRSPPGAKPTPPLIPSRPNTKPVIPCSERLPQCLDGPIPHKCPVLSLRTDDGSYSGITSPDPPASVGKSFNLGSPSFIGSTVSA